MMLDQIDVVGLQTFETGFQLALRNFFGAAVDLGHEKNLLPVSISQRVAHPDFAAAFVVIPTVVHKSDAAIDGGTNQANALVLGESGLRDVESPQADRGDCFSGASKGSIEHISLTGSWR